MEATRSSEPSDYIKPTQSHILEDKFSNLIFFMCHDYGCQNLIWEIIEIISQV
jgi:hypothetical protein